MYIKVEGNKGNKKSKENEPPVPRVKIFMNF